MEEGEGIQEGRGDDLSYGVHFVAGWFGGTFRFGIAMASFVIGSACSQSFVDPTLSYQDHFSPLALMLALTLALALLCSTAGSVLLLRN